MIECEVRFLNINVAEIQQKLLALGAKQTSDSVLKETIFDTKDRTWNKIQKRVRIRTNGNKSELAYKAQFQADTVDGVEEIETIVSDPDSTKAILEKLTLKAVREQEKKRISYKLDDIEFDIDTWPVGKPYLEIEADSELKLKNAAESLGLNWTDACFFDAKKIIVEIFGIKNFDNVKTFTFEKVTYHE